MIDISASFNHHYNTGSMKPLPLFSVANETLTHRGYNKRYYGVTSAAPYLTNVTWCGLLATEQDASHWKLSLLFYDNSGYI